MINGINITGMFNGKIRNRENIGMTKVEMFQKWNISYPDNQYPDIKDT